MSDQHDDLPRVILPIPDRRPAGLITYDAKDPDASFPEIEPLRPPAGAPNVLIVPTMSASAPRALSVDRSTHRPPSVSRRVD